MQRTISAHQVMNLPEKYKIFDFTAGFDPDSISEYIEKGGWAVGRYHEKRVEMYIAPQYGKRRDIHMGIDIWAPAGEPVFSPLDAEVLYLKNHDEPGNYGGAIVLKHLVQKKPVFALYGHLSLKSLSRLKPGQQLAAGDVIGWLGNEEENGNWPPHLHFQISKKDPGEADMPGVVAKEVEEKALELYPDPKLILGNLY